MKKISNKLIQNCTKLNPIHDVKLNYYRYGDNCGYWIIENLFENIDNLAKLMNLIPYYSPHEEYENSNYMDKQPIFAPFSFTIGRVFNDFINYEIKKSHTIENNVFISDSFINLWMPRKKYSYSKRKMLPHVDVFDINQRRVVFQIWMSDGDNGSTKFWKFRDNSYTATRDFFEYQEKIFIDQNYNFVYKSKKNFEGDSNFEEVESSPSKKGTVSVFLGNQYHSAYLPFSSKKFGKRWSYNLVSNIF